MKKIWSNLIYVKDLVKKIQKNPHQVKNEILKQFGGDNLKFDVVVGNPPYQENDNGLRDDGASNPSASNIYHYFYELAESLSERYISLIFPARWLNGAGKGLANFSEKMINNTTIRNLVYYKESNAVFPRTDIKGGVLYMLSDKNYMGATEIQYIDFDDYHSKFISYLNSEKTGVLIPYPEMNTIYRKVNIKENLLENNMSTLASVRKPFGLPTNFFNNPSKSKLPPIFIHKQSPTDIEIVGLFKKQRVSRYVPATYPIPQGKKSINNWNLFVAKAIGNGYFGEILPEIIIGKPGMICTETFIKIGDFESQFEAESCRKYLKTKFFRAFFGILKVTQDAPSRVYSLVPIQDFSNNSDINWNDNLSSIDNQLFKKYGLDESEIEAGQKVQSIKRQGHYRNRDNDLFLSF